MARRLIPGISGGMNTGPLVLLFSPRERVCDILTVGLVQCNYQIIQANSSYLASIKANQMLPKVVIIDVSAENSKDILLAERLRKSHRSRGIALLLIVPKQPDTLLNRVISELSAGIPNVTTGKIQLINYPFSFSDFLEKLKLLDIVDSGYNKSSIVDDSEKNKLIAERLFDLTIESSRKMFEIHNMLKNTWAFPFTIVRALDIMESEASCSVELARCISTDAAASSAVLKIANTVQFARRHGRITDVKDAVVRLGFRETRSIIACLSLINLSPDIYKSRGFERREFWLHSLTVGLIAEKICSGCNFRRPELGFMAGLLHDLGKIPLDNNFDWVFPKLLDKSMASYLPFFETEKQCMGFTHAELGHHLATQWNFPALISLAILHHHNSSRILKAPSQYDKIVQGAVFVANQLAKAVNIGHSCDEILEEIPAEMMRDLKLGNGLSDYFFKSVTKQLQILCQYLNIDLNWQEVLLPRAPVQESDIIVIYNDKVIFHPMVTALRYNGFHVHVSNHDIPQSQGKKRVIISIPERGLPLDIVFYGDDHEAKGVEDTLKIFLVDTEQPRSSAHEMSDINILFMDRNTFDIRLLIHTIDTFFEQIITPDSSKSDSDNQPLPA